jgi:predicted Zn finger-like uncharacterized protein
VQIRCEGCGACYELDEARLPGGDGSVRCMRCAHVFQARPRAEARPRTPPARTVIFAGERAAEKSAPQEPNESHAPEPEPTLLFELPGPKPGEAAPAAERTALFSASPVGVAGVDDAIRQPPPSRQPSPESRTLAFGGVPAGSARPRAQPAPAPRTAQGNRQSAGSQAAMASTNGRAARPGGASLVVSPPPRRNGSRRLGFVLGSAGVVLAAALAWAFFLR